jgi:hypothetical protein
VVKLSALVCVEGDAPHLVECLRGLAFCDEVVIVADRTTPRVQDLARRYGARLVAGIFPMDSQRRTAGAAACGGDWILEVEPDESVGSALAWEIRATLQMRPAGDWFETPVDNYVGEKLVQRGWGGPLGPARDARLHRRGAKRWSPRRLDGAELSGLPAGALKGALRRRVADGTGDLVERVNRLAAAAAEDRLDAGQAGGLAGGAPAALAAFAHSYLWAGGWREGRTGLLLALLHGLHPVLTASRVREGLEARRAAEPAKPLTPVLKLGVR